MWKDVPERRNADMEIGKKLKDARMKSGFTQETVAEKVNVSRQTISNWENEKSYPDIISVIELSSLYSISLDDLLKGDERMMEHLEESTNVVKSNQKLIGAIILNIITVILLITLSMFLPDKIYYLIMVFCLAIVSSAVYLNGQGWGVNQSFQNSSATAEGRKIHISISVLIRFILRWIIPL